MLKVNVPTGESGPWKVERFTVGKREADFENLRASIGTSSRGIEPGTYTRLSRNGETVMSDTPAEQQDLWDFEYAATGRVLMAGLGLGVALSIALAKKAVQRVDVIEQSPDVIALVGGHYQARFGSRLHIIPADVMTWQPQKGATWDCVWLDIWDGICADNLDGMRMLMRRYRRRATWVGAWCYDEHRESARRWA